MEPYFYVVDIAWSNGRRGTLCSSDLEFAGNKDACIDVATPPEFPKGVAGVWSPEHLFTAAVSSCLMTTFLSIAENSKLDFVLFSCHAKGKLEQVDGKFLMTEITLTPLLTLKYEKDRERALRVLQKTEAGCLISNSVKSKIIMTPTIQIEQA